MKSQFKILVALAFLASTSLAQLLSSNSAQLIAWKSYGEIIQQLFTAGQPLQTGVDYLFVTPPSTVAIRGGSPCPEAVTNFDLYNCADSLQKPGNPLLDPFGRSYFKSLETYLNSVDLGVGDLTDAQSAKMDQLTITLQNAKDKFDTEDQKAGIRYAAESRTNKGTFAAWVVANAPLWGVYHRQWQASNNALQQYMLQVFGPASDQLQRERDNCGFARSADAQPGYNMPVYPNAYTVKLNPFNAAPITNGLLTQPLYNIGTGFEEACNAWFTSPQAQSSLAWNLNEKSANDWTSLGHGSSVTRGGGSQFGLFSYKSSKTNTWSSYQFSSQQFAEQISLSLTMKGAPLIFNIGGGYWAVNDVRQVYPKLFSNATAGSTNGLDQLKDQIRIDKVMLAYELSFTLTISNSATYNSMSNFLNTARSDKGGGLSIWGFHFGANSDSSYSRDVSNITMSSTATGGIIKLAATPPGLTFMLGAMGKSCN